MLAQFHRKEKIPPTGYFWLAELPIHYAQAIHARKKNTPYEQISKKYLIII